MSDFFNFPMWAVEKPADGKFLISQVLIARELCRLGRDPSGAEEIFQRCTVDDLGLSLDDFAAKFLVGVKRPGRPKGSKNKEAA